MLVASGHLEVLRGFSSGHGYDVEELPVAAGFFKDLFGIHVRWSTSGVVATATSDTQADVRMITDRLKTSAHRVRWNEELGRVELVPENWKPSSKRSWEARHRLGVSFWHRMLGGIVQSMEPGGSRLDFTNASEVLTELTALPVDWSGSYVGVGPTAKTAEDLDQLRLWFKQHCARLYWDEARGELRLSQTTPAGPDAACGID
jgi:hypothetical protein